MSDIEDRIASLEASRQEMAAHISASSAMGLPALLHICMNSDDPKQVAKNMTDGFRKAANHRNYREIADKYDEATYRDTYLKHTNLMCDALIKTVDQLAEGTTLDDLISQSSRSNDDSAS